MVVLGESQEEGTGVTAFDKLKTAYVACRNSEDSLYYFTAMYVGLTLLRTPGAAKTGTTMHDELKKLVGSMDAVKKPTDFPGGASGYA